MPPLGALIVGPCPECQELVVVFGGRVLPLDKEIMLEAPFDEKREHLMAVLTSFLEERVVHLLKEATSAPEPDDAEPAPEADMPAHEQAPDDAMNGECPAKKGAISTREMNDFVRVDLKLLDNTDYFKAVFG